MTQKPAITQYPLHEPIKQRWSPLAFSDRTVPPETLCTLLEAARWAPSTYNDQPWYFILATKENPTEFDRLLSCLVEANQTWAQSAPVLMVAIASLKFSLTGEENRHAFHDVGLALANLSIQASTMDLYVHQMGGFLHRKVEEMYNVPPDHSAITAVALGYMGSPENLPEALQKREAAPRSRKPLESFVFTGKWGEKSSIF